MQMIQVIEAPGFVRWATRRVHLRLIWDANPSPSALARARLAGLVWIGLSGGFALTARAVRRPIPVEVVIPPGLHLALDATDALQLYLLLFGRWEPSQSALVQRVMGPGDTLIDIGAHIGYYSLLAAQQGARVVSVEPNPDVAPLLRKNVALNQVEERVDIVEAAVASDARGRVFYSGPRHNTGLSSTNPKWNLKNPRHVASILAQDLVSTETWATVKAVKVDVEGAELEILDGLADVAEAMPPDVVFLVELSPRWWKDGVSPDEVLRPFTRQGFKVFSVENSYSPMRYMSPGRTWDPIELPLPLEDKRRYDLVLAREETQSLLRSPLGDRPEDGS